MYIHNINGNIRIILRALYLKTDRKASIVGALWEHVFFSESVNITRQCTYIVFILQYPKAQSMATAKVSKNSRSYKHRSKSVSGVLCDGLTVQI